MRTDLISRIAALALAAALAGCALTPPSPPPAMDMPPGDAANAVAPQWWEAFADAKLDALVGEALANNLDVKAAIARVDEARGLEAYARSQLFPSLDLNARAGRSRISSVQGGFQLPEGTPLTANSYGVTLSAAYEVDLWGRVRSDAAAAHEDLVASQFATDTVRISVASETARAYFTLRALDAQLAMLQETLATRVKTVELQRDRYQSGVIGELELRQSEAERASVAADVATTERSTRLVESALAVLTGRSPRGVFATDIDRATPLARANEPLPAIPAGLPSDLLEQRPDIKAAEARLASADYRINEARAQYFPQISLTGNFGGASAALGDLLVAPGRVWSIAAALVQPVFRGGQISALVDTARARREQALIAYQQSVVAAFREAHDAFSAQRGSRDALAEQAERRDRTAQALELAQIRYDAGYSPFLEVLDAQRTLLAAERARIDAERDLKLAMVDVYRALGGGWKPDVVGAAK